MSARNIGGRPTSKNPLNHPLSIRLTDEEFKRIEDLANSLKITKSELGRRFIVKGKVVPLFSDQEEKTIKMLFSISNNLNQLVKQAHTFGYESVAKEVNIFKSEINTIIDKIQKSRLKTQKQLQ